MFKKTCLTLAVLALGGCRIVSQQELADLKSPPNPHMANMDKTWQQSIVPQVVTKARPAAELMSALKAAKDIDSACKTLGYRAQDENPCIFYVKVSGTVSKLDTASRSGKMTLTDASVGKVTVQIGPTLRGTQLRDGYSGASYQDFNDQVLFGEYSKNINSQAVKMIQTANVKTGDSVEVYGVFSAWDIPAGICGMVAGALLTNGLPLWNGDILFFNVPEVILCVAIFGVLVGLVNGAVITRFGVAPFICTLGMMYVARGSALLFNDGSTYPNLNGMEALGNTGFATLGSGTLLGVYLPIWLMIGFLVLGYWLTTKTPLGRYIYAIGGNESAARLAGVPIVKAKIFVYAFSGLCAAFVGLIVASQLQTAHPMTGNMFEMDAIGATVLGGTALAGGRGRVTGSIIGAFVIVFLADGMVMMGVSDFWQMVIKGVVIVTAVVVDQFQQKLQSKVILMRRHEEKLAAIPPNGATSS